jgi:acyl-CoA synthetase (AMP-forming)/AMP-acid ligase II
MVTRLVARCVGRTLRAENLKCLVYGGAPMYVADLEKALAVFGPRLYQLFGQGESPMSITGLPKHLHQASDSQQRLARLGSVGYARTGVEVRVVDADGRPLPVGEVGEIITRSDGVMLGYWNNPIATQESIRDGWLYTGDLGALQADGLLVLHDRSKDLIISGGSNIYPREIEEVLLRDPRVLECAVIGRHDADWGEVPVAFVVAQAGVAIASEELDALLFDNLARFKRPKHYLFVDELPKNNYGKVLKTSLRHRIENS